MCIYHIEVHTHQRYLVIGRRLVFDSLEILDPRPCKRYQNLGERGPALISHEHIIHITYSGSFCLTNFKRICFHSTSVVASGIGIFGHSTCFFSVFSLYQFFFCRSCGFWGYKLLSQQLRRSTLTRETISG